jgi:hypothetical protein
MSDEPESSTTTVTTFATSPDTAVNRSSIGDAAALIAALGALVNASTATIMARLEENSRGATERWRLNDERVADDARRSEARVEKIEKSILVVQRALEMHLDGHHDEAVVMDGRVRPLKNGVAWMVANYKNIVILLIGLLGFFAVAADLASRYLGGP